MEKNLITEVEDMLPTQKEIEEFFAKKKEKRKSD